MDMDLATMRAEITRLARSLDPQLDLPVREMFSQQRDLACLLLAAQEFVLDREYLTFLTSCGLTPATARRCIADLFKRHAYRWNHKPETPR